MKIAIFGGTFNPVHNEHVELVKAAIKELSLDKLFIVPTFAPPHKNVVPAPAEDRLNMLKLAFSGVDKAEISDFELKNGGKSYSYVTAEHFSGLYPEAKLYFLVGDDMLTDFKTWRFPERLLDVAELAVFGRENFTAEYAAEEKYFAGSGTLSDKLTTSRGKPSLFMLTVFSSQRAATAMISRSIEAARTRPWL